MCAIVMSDKLKQGWQRFKRAKPGQRFQQRYYQRQQSGRSTFRRAAVMAVGGLICAAGIVLLAIPGPGLLVLFIGASFIAEESLIAARALDWVELRARRLYTGGLRLWRRTSPALRVAVAIGALAVVAALAFGAYKIAFAAITGAQ
jgi:uncharacterized protein (TIGR02611 family)